MFITLDSPCAVLMILSGFTCKDTHEKGIFKRGSIHWDGGQKPEARDPRARGPEGARAVTPDLIRDLYGPGVVLTIGPRFGLQDPVSAQG